MTDAVTDARFRSVPRPVDGLCGRKADCVRHQSGHRVSRGRVDRAASFFILVGKEKEHRHIRCATSGYDSCESQTKFVKRFQRGTVR
jgi:hypothetical protein